MEYGEKEITPSEEVTMRTREYRKEVTIKKKKEEDKLKTIRSLALAESSS
jgi:hypothetical protein